MKRIILSLALLAGVSSAASAQTGLKLGLKAGLNIATFTSTNGNPFGFKYGFCGGGLVNYGFTDKVSLQLEGLYSQKGTASDITLVDRGVSTTYNIQQTLHYIDIPLLLKISTSEEGKGLFFEAGPMLSLIVAQRTFSDDANLGKDGNPISLNGASTKATQRGVIIGNSTNYFNPAVLAIAVGVGYQITNGLGLSIRYTNDVTRVYHNTAFPDTSRPVTVHNSVFQFQAHYLFSLGAKK